MDDLPLDFLTFLERRLRLDRESTRALLTDWLVHYERDEERATFAGPVASNVQTGRLARLVRKQHTRGAE